ERAGIRSSVIVLLGLGGKKYSAEHVRGTIEALNRMQPRYLSFLSLMVIPGTPLAGEIRRGDFTELGSAELLKEAYEMIRGLELKHTVFRSNHASNYLALEGTFPKDKPALLKALKGAIDGEITLRPDFARGL
ncbi:MAG: radical SAM protein, partial [Candidatus Omnitrophota bacterium]